MEVAQPQISPRPDLTCPVSLEESYWCCVCRQADSSPCDSLNRKSRVTTTQCEFVYVCGEWRMSAVHVNWQLAQQLPLVAGVNNGSTRWFTFNIPVDCILCLIENPVCLSKLCLCLHREQTQWTQHVWRTGGWRWRTAKQWLIELWRQGFFSFWSPVIFGLVRIYNPGGRVYL